MDNWPFLCSVKALNNYYMAVKGVSLKKKKNCGAASVGVLQVSWFYQLGL